jgi:tetratricopeptide (TPR) repeat protein
MASSARIDELRKKFDENPRRYFAPLANEYRKSGDLQQAVFICQEYLPQQPGHMSGHIVFGQALFEMGRAEEANVVFETALSLDPENLIALRHLGDIARQRGDLTAARIWYQRVLEADPRNEEIAQLMISLLAIPEAPPKAPPKPQPVQTPPLGREPLSREPLRPATPTPVDVPVSDFAPPAGPRTAEYATDERFVVEKSESASELESARTPAPPIVTEPPPPPPPVHTTAATKAGDGREFLNLDDFNLGGSPTPVSVPTPPMPNPAQSVAAKDEPATQPPDDQGFDLGTEDGPFEIDPYAVAAAPADEPSVLDGLETFEPGAFEATPVAFESLEREEFFEPAAIGEALAEVAPTIDSAPEPVPEPIAESGLPEAAADESEPDDEAVPQAFVTETMAELYLRQDHLDAALDIYRQLVEQRPHDMLLGERLRAVEQRVHDAAVAGAAAASASAPAVPVYGGPTIREFLSGLAAGRRTLHTQAVHQPEGASEPESEPSRAFSNDSVSGSIDALFSSADASAADTAAANTLQEAFAAESADAAPLHGVPAHTASSELSLDHVFKGNAPPPPEADGFSFDQFFADEMTETAQHATNEGAAPAQPVDDIAQFNAWLNGLKKT